MDKIKLKEKIGYALGDTAANIAWRTLTTFLLIFYTDVFGISAAAAGVLLLVTRLTDGFTDVIMGMIADRTNTSKGKFRPWTPYVIKRNDGHPVRRHPEASSRLVTVTNQ